MAAGEGVPQLGGYNYEFLSEVPDRLKCSICLLTLKDPMQVTKCGHRFCKPCIDRILNNPLAACPEDRQPFSENEVFGDMACEREISDLHVRCLFQHCPWTGELRGVESHETICPFKMVECTNEICDEKFMRKDLDHHVTRECQWRSVPCLYCQDSYIWKLSQEHIDVCKKLPLSCFNRCGKSDIPREEMTAHINDFCPLTVTPCKYEHVGCKQKIRRDALQDHIKEGVETHLDLACSKLKQVELECAECKESELQLFDKLKQVESVAVSHQVNSTLFTWRIQNFDQSWRAAKEGCKKWLDSEPFYTSPHKYKLKMRVDPNGCGEGKNTHLSVFITIMKGEYDAILPWPFLSQVTFTLIDQQEDTSQRENVVESFKANSTVESYSRPVGGENPGRGYPTFVSHEQLQTRRYIVDNTIFLQVKVEVPEIDCPKKTS